jgi:flagellar protein FlaG
MISNLSQVISMPLSPVREATTSPLSNVAVQPVAAVNTQASVKAGDAGSDQGTNMGSGENSSASNQALADAVDQLNSKIQNLNRNLEFSINQDSGGVLVKVVDANTREVIRQIPSEEAVVLARNIDQYMQEHHVGLVETKA